MPRGVLSTILKLAIASLLVGLALSLLGITPASVFEALGDTARRVFDATGDFLRWAMKYVLIGAAVVVPIWLVFFLFRLLRGR